MVTTESELKLSSEGSRELNVGLRLDNFLGILFAVKISIYGSIFIASAYSWAHRKFNSISLKLQEPITIEVIPNMSHAVTIKDSDHINSKLVYFFRSTPLT